MDFARDREFEVEKQNPKDITFLLRSDAETKKNYPFDFEFRIRYQISGDELSTEYLVTNTGNRYHALLCWRSSGISPAPDSRHPVFRIIICVLMKPKTYPAGRFPRKA